MKLFLIVLFFFLTNCSKPKTVLICGDHVCLNKAEAEQYFEENLSIEVKIIDKKNLNNDDLVELNLSENKQGKRKVSIKPKNESSQNLKTLSSNEIKEIKRTIKDKNKEKKITKKKLDKKKVKEVGLNREKKKFKNKSIVNKVNKNQKNVVDVCTIITKCSIEEISKYLLKKGKIKSYPDITLRQ